MKLQNIDRLLLFRENAAGHVLSLDELQSQYHIEPDGTLFYYGLNQANASNVQQNGTAFNADHASFFSTLVSSINAGTADEKTLVLGVEPLEPIDPYGFVSSNVALVKQLAIDLSAVQAKVQAGGKRLNIIIRYASEMNDTGQAQGGNSSGYRSTFVQVRLAFAAANPSILFSFSPALRADLDESLIGQYWPGDDYVDIIGGTWYIGSAAQRDASVTNMRDYFLHRVGTGKALALSEVGGCNADGAGNDGVLQDMFHQIEAFQLQNISFKYVTIFLASKYGTDATLNFIST